LGQKLDLEGKTFGKWLVLQESSQRSANGSVMWFCRCACGTCKLVDSASLNQGRSRSCARCARMESPNSYRDLGDGSTQVICTDGDSFLIDTEDVPVVRRYNLYIDKRNYVKTKYYGHQLLLSRLLLGVTGSGRSIFVDHISGDPKDNRRKNLRACLPSENIKNRKLNTTNRTGYKGVSFHARLQKYRADIRSGGGKTIYLGCYRTAKEAAAAYDRAALLLHGQFARTNEDLGLMGVINDHCQAI